MTKEECPNCPGRDDHDAEHCPIKPSNADECKRFAGELWAVHAQGPDDITRPLTAPTPSATRQS